MRIFLEITRECLHDIVFPFFLSEPQPRLRVDIYSIERISEFWKRKWPLSCSTDPARFFRRGRLDTGSFRATLLPYKSRLVRQNADAQPPIKSPTLDWATEWCNNPQGKQLRANLTFQRTFCVLCSLLEIIFYRK